MLQPICQTEHLSQDLHITHAKGYAFDALAGFYGFPRLKLFSVAAWRRGLHAVAMGRRGTLGCTHAAIENIFLYAVKPYTVRVQTASPNVMTFVSPPAGTAGIDGFKCYNVQRLWRLVHPTYFPKPGILVWSVGPNITNGTSATLNVAPFETTYWKDGRWGVHFNKAGIDVPDGGIDVLDVEAYLLPLWYQEPSPGPLVDDDNKPIDYYQASAGTPCSFRLWLDTQLINIPSTYLNEDGEEKPANMPYGPHIMDLFDFTTPGAQKADQTNDTAWPLYFDSEGLTADTITSVFDPLLAAGVHVESLVVDFCKGQEQNDFFDG